MTGLKPYPEYKATGIGYLKEIPATWELSRLKHLGCIRYGIGEPPRYMDSGVPLVRATNVSEGSVTTDKMVFVNPSDIPSQRIVWLQCGDIIVVRSGANTGDSALIREEFDGAIAGFDMVFRANAGISPDFMQYALLAPYVRQAQLNVARARAAQPHLNAEELGNCLFVLPRPEDQRAIAHYLDRETAEIDAFIADQEELMVLLNERRSATITQVVTKGLNPSVSMKDSGLPWIGEMPGSWTKQTLSRLGIRQSSGTSVNGFSEAAASGEVGVLKTGCASKGYFDPSENKRVLEEDLRKVSCPVVAGALIVNRANTPDLVGSAAHVQGDFPNLFLSDKLWQIFFDQADTRFIYWWTKTAAYRAQLHFHRVGASASMQNLSFGDFGSFDIAVPPISEQLEIVEYLDRESAEIDAAIADAREAIELSRERRASLISAVVTGRNDVRGLS